jgi:GMP synthase (glutamine-hydrolysing)
VRVLTIVHEADAGPGVFADAVRARGDTLDAWVLPSGAPAPEDPRGYDAVLALGGSMHPDQTSAHPWLAYEKTLLADLLHGGTALLGVCLGAQLLAEAAGARTRAAPRPEVGWHHVEVGEAGCADPLLGPLAPGFEALVWHSYEFALPDGAVPLARSAACLQAYRLGAVAWGIQFHAEVSLPDLESWIDHERSAQDQSRLGFEPRELRAQSVAKIAAWNELGAGLCDRFLEAVARHRAADVSPTL